MSEKNTEQQLRDALAALLAAYMAGDDGMYDATVHAQACTALALPVTPVRRDLCLNCRCWSGMDSKPNISSGLRYGDCRRRSPSLVVLTIPAQYPETHFPLIAEDGWCAEFMPMEEKD